jgi:DNA invertase Pin-like site-specific DNA recombinase
MKIFPSPLVPAAQYLRVSTDHQQYSLDNQSEAILEYAKSHGFDIVQTYPMRQRAA